MYLVNRSSSKLISRNFTNLFHLRYENLLAILKTVSKVNILMFNNRNHRQHVLLFTFTKETFETFFVFKIYQKKVEEENMKKINK